MSIDTTEAGLMNSIQHAEKDLALYAAIIGCKPTVDPAQTAPDAPHDEDHAAVDHEPYRITIWMRHVSHEAKKRIHEARMRLAS